MKSKRLRNYDLLTMLVKLLPNYTYEKCEHCHDFIFKFNLHTLKNKLEFLKLSCITYQSRRKYFFIVGFYPLSRLNFELKIMPLISFLR